MLRNWLPRAAAVVFAVALWAGDGSKAVAQQPPLPQMYYYPYYYSAKYYRSRDRDSARASWEQVK